MSEASAALPPPAPPPRVRLPWPRRAAAVLWTYLPMLVMALLAIGSWWLVSKNPISALPVAEAPLRHDPDYTMHSFSVQRFARDGSMRMQIEGDVALHYPNTDTLEIENPRIRTVGQDGTVTTATAARALANGDGSEVQLSIGARVLREARGEQEAIEFRSEFLHVFAATERVRSHLPVTVTQGGTRLRAGGMSYDHLARTVDLAGRIEAVFPARAAGR